MVDDSRDVDDGGVYSLFIFYLSIVLSCELGVCSCGTLSSIYGVYIYIYIYCVCECLFFFVVG